MPKVYYVRDELGEDGEFHPTLKAAQAEFQSMVNDGIEPEGVHSVWYVPTRRGVCDLLNLFRQSKSNEAMS